MGRALRLYGPCSRSQPEAPQSRPIEVAAAHVLHGCPKVRQVRLRETTSVIGQNHAVALHCSKDHLHVRIVACEVKVGTQAEAGAHRRALGSLNARSEVRGWPGERALRLRRGEADS